MTKKYPNRFLLMLLASYHILLTSVWNPFSKLPKLPVSFFLPEWLDHKFRMSRQPWWRIASFNLVDDQRCVGVTSKGSWERSQTYTNVRFLHVHAQWRAHLSLWAGFQLGTVASQPGWCQGNSGSDRLIGLDPDRLMRWAPPVRGPELTPWSRFNSSWRCAEVERAADSEPQSICLGCRCSLFNHCCTIACNNQRGTKTNH